MDYNNGFSISLGQRHISPPFFPFFRPQNILKKPKIMGVKKGDKDHGEIERNIGLYSFPHSFPF